jgi:quercetin dioxygenase-like cupin family protein
MRISQSLLSHAVVAATAAASAALLTYIAVAHHANVLAPASAYAQAPGQKSTEVVTQAMPDIGREMRISLTERDPGNASAPHRHPGQHTFGYVLEGTYEVKINDGPVQLKAGEAFYEPPGALHAISRNPSSDKPVRYLIIQVGDPSKPRIVLEP